MRPRTVCLVLAVSAMVAISAAAPQSNWRRLDSPNFVVIGEVDAGELKDIAVKFEAFREILGRLMNERVTSTPVPTVVVVFRGEATFQPFMPVFQGKRVDVGGLFVPRRDINHIAMVADRDHSRLRVIFHEYAHLLVSNTGQRIPVWLNEGLAEYYSTFELQRGGREAVIGRVVESHIQRLNESTLLKLPELLNVDHQSPLYNEGNRRSIFYAQAWALTHLILRSDRAAQLGAYLDHLSKGLGPSEAWQRAFGAQDLARELDTYIRRQAFTATLYRFSDKLATFESQSAVVPPADVQAYLAGFLVQQRRLDEAAQRLGSAARTDALNPRARVATALLELERQNPQAAHTNLRSLPSLDDWLLNYQAGIALVASIEARGQMSPQDVSPQDVELAGERLTKASADRAAFANAIARLASLELRTVEGPTPKTRTALEQAVAAAPGRYEYRFLLAQVLARQSEFAQARAVLGPLMTPQYPDSVRESARRLMASVVSVEAARSGRQTSASSAANAVSTTVSTATSTDPGEPEIRPSFRVLQPGEERVEGVLENIECVSSKGISFKIKAAEGVLTLTSPSFSTVDFITYRSDLKGSIQCGPVTPALNVYATWRAGSTTGSKVAVALEFLPKGK